MTERASVVAAMVALVACKKALVFSPDALPAGEVGKPYRAEVEIVENTTPVGGMNADALPPGLEIHFTRETNTGVIDGTPTKAGDYPFKLSAWCYGTNVSGQQGTHAYRIVVK
jgi:hypothetical protein